MPPRSLETLIRRAQAIGQRSGGKEQEAYDLEHGISQVSAGLFVNGRQVTDHACSGCADGETLEDYPGEGAPVCVGVGRV